MIEFLNQLVPLYEVYFWIIAEYLLFLIADRTVLGVYLEKIDNVIWMIISKPFKVFRKPGRGKGAGE